MMLILMQRSKCIAKMKFHVLKELINTRNELIHAMRVRRQFLNQEV